MKKPVKDRFSSFIIILIFGAAIFVPFLLGIMEKDQEKSEIEKRKLAELPELPATSHAVRKFPEAFDIYYADHFGLREKLTQYYKQIKYQMGDSPSQDVTIGKNGWLFLGSIKNGYMRYDDPMGDVRNANLYSQADLEKTTQYLTQLNTWLNHQGIKYLLVIAPNKHSIYFDQLPGYILKEKEKSATDQLVEHLRSRTDLSIVDLREDFLKEKEKHPDHPLYSKTDTHWNHYGANLAQYKIMQAVERLFPGQIKPEMFPLKEGQKEGGDLANFIGIDMFEELNPQPIFTNTCFPLKKPELPAIVCEGQKLKTLIFRDSFFTALAPYFVRKFYQSTFIWERLNYLSLAQFLAKDKPDIVIEEWVERVLPYIPEEIPELNIRYTQKVTSNN